MYLIVIQYMYKYLSSNIPRYKEQRPLAPWLPQCDLQVNNRHYLKFYRFITSRFNYDNNITIGSEF